MKSITVLLLLLLSLSGYSQQACHAFKTGRFQNIENGVVKSTIERSSTVQRESFGDKEIKLQITWIDDCSYRLKLVWGNDAFWNGRPKDMSTPDLLVKITKVNGSEYSQEAKSEGDDFVYKSTLVKID